MITRPWLGEHLNETVDVLRLRQDQQLVAGPQKCMSRCLGEKRVEQCLADQTSRHTRGSIAVSAMSSPDSEPAFT
jgi:hypothetical protein